MHVYPSYPDYELRDDTLKMLQDILERAAVRSDLGYVNRTFKVEKSENSNKWLVVCEFHSFYGEYIEKVVVTETENEDYANMLVAFNPWTICKLLDDIKRKQSTISRLEKQMDNIIESHITTDPDECHRIRKYDRCNICPNQTEGQVATYLLDYYNPCLYCSNMKEKK